MAKQSQRFLKVSTEWIELETISEADVVLTTFGYTPFLRVREMITDIDYGFYISAKSLAIPLEKLRKDNNGIFEGIQFRVRKESTDQKAPYEVDTNISVQKRPQPSVPVNTDEDSRETLKSSEDIKKKLEEVLLSQSKNTII